MLTVAQPPFQPAHQPGEENHHNQINHRRRHQRQKALIGYAANDIDTPGQIGESHITGHGGLLEQDNKLVGQGGEYVFERLGQDDVPHGLGIIEAQAPSGLGLPNVDRHNARTDNLRDVGRRVEAESDDAHQNLVIGAGHDDKEQNHNLHHNRGSPDNGQIDLGEGVEQPQERLTGAGAHCFAVFVPRGADDRNNRPHRDAQ